MTDATRGLLDTSVVIDYETVDVALIPDHSAVSAVTFAELAAGPHAAADSAERTRRQDRLQWAAATWDPVPFDAAAARAYARVYAASRAAGRTSSRRFADLLIAATALANDLAIYTRNPADFTAFGGEVTVVGV